MRLDVTIIVLETEPNAGDIVRKQMESQGLLASNKFAIDVGTGVHENELAVSFPPDAQQLDALDMESEEACGMQEREKREKRTRITRARIISV